MVLDSCRSSILLQIYHMVWPTISQVMDITFDIIQFFTSIWHPKSNLLWHGATNRSYQFTEGIKVLQKGQKYKATFLSKYY